MSKDFGKWFVVVFYSHGEAWSVGSFTEQRPTCDHRLTPVPVNNVGLDYVSANTLMGLLAAQHNIQLYR